MGFLRTKRRRGFVLVTFAIKREASRMGTTQRATTRWRFRGALANPQERITRDMLGMSGSHVARLDSRGIDPCSTVCRMTSYPWTDPFENPRFPW